MNLLHKRRMTTAVTFLLAACLLLSVRPAAASSPPNTNIGLKEVGKLKTRTAKEIKASLLGVGCEVLDRDYASYHDYKEYLGKLGVKHARFQSGWAKTEKQRGVYDFKWLDETLDDCLSRDIQPWVCICYGNKIYPGGGDEQSSSPIPAEGEALEAWLKYVGELVERNKEKVFEWEVWNESDHGGFKGATAEAYAAFYLATAKVIREKQPSSRIMIGGMCTSGVSKYIRTVFEYLQAKGELDKVNVITFHGYVPNPDQTFRENLELVDYVKQFREDIEARQGENGAPSNNASSGALSNLPFTELSQAKWNLRRALGTIGNNIPFSLFTISDFSYPPNFNNQAKGLNTKGLLEINDDLSIARAKQVYFGYQYLTSLFDGDIEATGRKDELIQSDSTLSLYTFRDAQTATPLLAWWNSSRMPGETLEVQAATVDLKNYKFKQPVLVDIRSGQIYQVPAVSSDGKIRLPAYDSPLVLCEKELLKRKKLL